MSPSSGTCSFTIPIAVSAARGQPALALTYDSGSGNSPFGIGWSLDAPSISRKTERGVPAYTDDDVFVFGGDDLVPLLLERGDEWIRDERTEGEHTVRRYRPRIEGAFARIERWMRIDDGDVWWMVTGRDNRRQVYGRSTACRLVDPDDPRRVARWLLEESSDDLGTIVSYEYKAEDRAGVLAASFEQARELTGSRCAQTFLKRIRYGNRVPFVPGQWMFEVVFDYGEHDDGVQEVRPWPARQDAFSRCRVGFDVRTYRLCRRVLMFHQFPELGTSPVLVHATALTYDESPAVTRLVRVVSTGYSDGRAKSLPPIDLHYSEAAIAEELGAIEGADNLPSGIDGHSYQWLDLDGDGVAGVLARQGPSWTFMRNEGAGLLGPAQPVPDVPSSRNGDIRMMSLGGDGRLDVVHLDPALAGYQERTAGGWERFVAFSSLPRIAWDDPNLRFLDVDGDGTVDVLVTHDDALIWFRGQGHDGWSEARRVPKPGDEERGPAIVFADAEQTIFLADMTGDGLTDLVRIRNGAICYWPNRGNGRFGAKVTMANAPLFACGDEMDTRRIRLADVGGSGPTDVIYLDDDGARVWLNNAGNSFGAAISLERFPGVDGVASVEVLDVLGDGTGCLVWSSALPSPAPRCRYLRLMARGKPHLLTSIVNNLGAETAIDYAPSTRFFLADRAAGRPWISPLPFPVQVIERVTVMDRITDRRLVTTYAYHHGFYDGVEREFRGFACVEQRDAESFDELPDGARNALHCPPVLTRSWFHTGAWRDGESIAQRLAGEYYGSTLLPDATLPEGLDAGAAREACRALRGRALRSEVYAEDGGPRAEHPYATTESSYQLRLVQPRENETHPVFLVIPGETLTHHYERNPDDPRVAHTLTLATDEFGIVTRSASVAYPRRAPAYPEQGATSVVISETMVLHQLAPTYHLGVPIESKSWELPGFTATSDRLVSAAALDSMFAAAAELPHEATGSGKRLLAHERSVYWDDAITGPLPFGVLGTRPLLCERSRLALTTGQIAAIYGGRVTPAMLQAAGYVEDDGGWWGRSGRQVPDASLFYQPTRSIDPLGAETTIEYDAYGLFAKTITDAAGNITRAEYDYRVLQPRMVTDPNGNRSAVAFDELGLPVASAVMGKDGANEGDTLESPTRRLTYDLHAWVDRRNPAVVHVATRERHREESWQHAYQYFNGTGGVVMSKVQAAAGPAPQRDGSNALVLDDAGEPVLVEAAQRWIGTGRVVVDNKGNPVKQYEPFFSSTSEFESEAELVQQGVTPVLHYDPLGRNIRTDLPDGTFRRVDFDAWSQTTWDPVDTVLESAWYAERIALPASDPERRAAALAAAHASTPGVAHLDHLGRTFLAIDDNGSSGHYETRSVLDVQGHALAIIDARGITTAAHAFPVAGAAVHASSPDAGDSWTLFDVTAKPAFSWRPGVFIRQTYDTLRRPTELWVDEGGGERLVQRTVYGEAHAAPEAANLRGVVHLVLDGAGLVINEVYDFEGRLTRSSRRLAITDDPDWAVTSGRSTAASVLAGAELLLDLEAFTASSSADALGRPTTQVAPDGSETRFGYDAGGRLFTVSVERGGATTPIVTSVTYEARGQRMAITYGNGVTTAYSYEPKSLRLARIATTRSDGAALQELAYTYDAAGNIVAIADAAQPTLFFANAVVPAAAEYEYDAIHRLVRATGREHAGGAQIGVVDPGYANIPNANDAAAVVRYTEEYTYDPVGNIASVRHATGATTWTRRYQYAATSNRLTATSEPGDPALGPYRSVYPYDARGSMTAMPHLVSITRDWRDQIAAVDLGGGGTAAYIYDGANQRVRKRVTRQGAVSEDRIYLGAYEIYRKRRGSTLEEERTTLHVVDSTRRVAMIETLIVTGSAAVPSPTPRLRYQLDNHLGSALLELDERGAIISYEEYHPYGTTAYQAASASEVSAKRYRYTGKEKDDETGLYYHGARYYAPWLARWERSDPIGLEGGINLYRYASSNPVLRSDPSGLADIDPEAKRIIEAAGFTVVETDAMPNSRIPELGGYKVITAQAPDEDVPRMYRVLESGSELALQPTSMLDEYCPPLALTPGCFVGHLLRGGPSAVGEQAVIYLGTAGLVKGGGAAISYGARQMPRVMLGTQLAVAELTEVPALSTVGTRTEVVAFELATAEASTTARVSQATTLARPAFQSTVTALGESPVISSVAAARPATVYAAFGLAPADFGFTVISQDPVLAAAWARAVVGASTGPRSNAYQRLVSKQAAGGTITKPELRAAFGTLRGYFARDLAKQGIKVGDVHHWNHLSQDPRNALNPDNLVAIPKLADAYKSHYAIHLATAADDALPYGPANPIHNLPFP